MFNEVRTIENVQKLKSYHVQSLQTSKCHMQEVSTHLKASFYYSFDEEKARHHDPVVFTV